MTDKGREVTPELKHAEECLRRIALRDGVDVSMKVLLEAYAIAAQDSGEARPEWDLPRESDQTVREGIRALLNPSRSAVRGTLRTPIGALSATASDASISLLT